MLHVDEIPTVFSAKLRNFYRGIDANWWGTPLSALLCIYTRKLELSWKWHSHGTATRKPTATKRIREKIFICKISRVVWSKEQLNALMLSSNDFFERRFSACPGCAVQPNCNMIGTAVLLTSLPKRVMVVCAHLLWTKWTARHNLILYEKRRLSAPLTNT